MASSSNPEDSTDEGNSDLDRFYLSPMDSEVRIISIYINLLYIYLLYILVHIFTFFAGASITKVNHGQVLSIFF